MELWTARPASGCLELQLCDERFREHRIAIARGPQQPDPASWQIEGDAREAIFTRALHRNASAPAARVRGVRRLGRPQVEKSAGVVHDYEILPEEILADRVGN